MKKKYYYIFIIAFFAVILLPSTGMPFYDANSAHENRNLTELPNFSKLKLRHYIKQMNAYLADHHAFRNELSNRYFHFVTKYLNESPVPSQVAIGKDNWLFLGTKNHTEYAYALGIKDIDYKDLDKRCANINQMKEYSEARGIKFYIMLPPNKSSIYSEYFPYKTSTKQKGKSIMTKILKDQYGISVIDVEDILKAKKDSVMLYYKQDSHWNNLGAIIGTKYLVDIISQDFNVPHINLEDYSIKGEETNRKGDLATMLSLPYNDYDYTIKRRIPHHMIYKEAHLETSQDEYIYTQNTTCNNTVKGLFFRDSFFGAMQPFVSDIFNEAMIVKNETGTFDSAVFDEIISNYIKPDFFVFEIVERHYDIIDFKEEKVK